MKPTPMKVAGRLVLAVRTEGRSRLQSREFSVGIADEREAIHAVIAAFPELDDGFQVESTLPFSAEDLERHGISPGQIIEAGESVHDPDA